MYINRLNHTTHHLDRVWQNPELTYGEVNGYVHTVVRWLSEKKEFSIPSKQASSLANHLNWTVPQLKDVISDIMKMPFPSRTEYLAAKDRLGIKDLALLLDSDSGSNVHKDDEFIDLLAASRALCKSSARYDKAIHKKYINAGGRPEMSPQTFRNQMQNRATISVERANKIFAEYVDRKEQASQPVESPNPPDTESTAPTKPISEPAGPTGPTHSVDVPVKAEPSTPHSPVTASALADQADFPVTSTATPCLIDQGEPSTHRSPVMASAPVNQEDSTGPPSTPTSPNTEQEPTTPTQAMENLSLDPPLKVRIASMNVGSGGVKRKSTDGLTPLRNDAIALIIKHWENHMEEGETRDPAYVDCGPLPDIIALPEAKKAVDYYRGYTRFNEKKLIPTTHKFFQNTKKEVALTVRNDWTAEQVDLKFPDDTIDGMFDGRLFMPRDNIKWKAFFETLNDRTLLVKVTPTEREDMTFLVCAAHLNRHQKLESFQDIAEFLDLYAEKYGIPVIIVGDLNLNLTGQSVPGSGILQVSTADTNLSPPRSENGASLSAFDPHRTSYGKAPIDYVVTTDSSTDTMKKPHITRIEHVLTIQVTKQEIVVIKNEDGVAEGPTVGGSQGRLTEPILSPSSIGANLTKIVEENPYLLPIALDHDPIIADVTLSNRVTERVVNPTPNDHTTSQPRRNTE